MGTVGVGDAAALSSLPLLSLQPAGNSTRANRVESNKVIPGAVMVRLLSCGYVKRLANLIGITHRRYRKKILSKIILIKPENFTGEGYLP